jgi:hypothetical protein
MVGFYAFRRRIESLDHRNTKLKKRKLCPTADLIMERAKGQSLRQRDLIQADFLMYIRDQLHSHDGYNSWWPNTLLYAQSQAGPFEVFARSKSTTYFNRLCPALGISSLEDMQAMFEKFKDPRYGCLQWDHVALNPLDFIGYKELCTRP